MASDRRYRFIRPRFYRYRVADPGLRATVNNYTGERPIGLIAAEALMNLLIRAFQLARHSGDHS